MISSNSRTVLIVYTCYMLLQKINIMINTEDVDILMYACLVNASVDFEIVFYIANVGLNILICMIYADELKHHDIFVDYIAVRCGRYNYVACQLKRVSFLFALIYSLRIMIDTIFYLVCIITRSGRFDVTQYFISEANVFVTYIIWAMIIFMIFLLTNRYRYSLEITLVMIIIYEWISVGLLQNFTVLLLRGAFVIMLALIAFLYIKMFYINKDFIKEKR